MKKNRSLLIFLSVLLHAPILLPAVEKFSNISIGVLAKRSTTLRLRQWQPLADYLNNTILLLKQIWERNLLSLCPSRQRATQ